MTDEQLDPRALTLCGNCLSGGAKPYQVGTERGSQRDPYYTVVTLCANCIGHIEGERWDYLSLEQTDTRDVDRIDLLTPKDT